MINDKPSLVSERHEQLGEVSRRSTNGRYVVVTPIRDEEAFIEKTIQSVTSQTILPIEWIIVNDGSTDRTAQIIDEYVRQYAWIHAVHRDNRGFRSAGRLCIT